MSGKSAPPIASASASGSSAGKPKSGAAQPQATTPTTTCEPAIIVVIPCQARKLTRYRSRPPRAAVPCVLSGLSGFCGCQIEIGDHHGLEEADVRHGLPFKRTNTAVIVVDDARSRLGVRWRCLGNVRGPRLKIFWRAPPE